MNEYYDIIILGLITNVLMVILFSVYLTIKMLLLINSPNQLMKFKKLSHLSSNLKVKNKYWYNLFLPFAKILEVFIWLKEENNFYLTHGGDLIDFLIHRYSK